MFHGILLINKEKGFTSHKVVSQIRALLKQRAVGHAGTLDPMARGLLVALCGSGTKLSPYLLNQNKSYRLSFKLGIETDTLDIEGKILSSPAPGQEIHFDKKELEQILHKETKELEIPVPIFSAVKREGRKMYEYAFKGQPIIPPLKKMSFWGLQIHDIQRDGAEVSLSCSKGSYVRSWVRHIGLKTGTGACLTALNRLSSGEFKLEDSLSCSQLEALLSGAGAFPKTQQEIQALLGKSFLFPHQALKGFPQVELTKRQARFLSYGRVDTSLIVMAQPLQIETNKSGQNQILKAVRGGSLLALLELKPFKKIKILRNLWTSS